MKSPPEKHCKIFRSYETVKFEEDVEILMPQSEKTLVEVSIFHVNPWASPRGCIHVLQETPFAKKT